MYNFKAALVPMLYAIIVIIGGVMGYLKAQSLISLVMGLSFGIPIFGASLTVLRNKMSGYYTAVALIVVLTLFFHYRFVQTQVFMPSGLMAIVSIVTLLTMFFYPAKREEQ